MIQNQIISMHHWLSAEEFNHLITISQMTPEPSPSTARLLLGSSLMALPAATATLGCVLPSCIIVTLLAHFYFKYRDLSVIRTVLGTLRPAVIALIATAGLTMLIPVVFQDSALRVDAVRIEGIVLFAGCFGRCGKRCSPILVMVLAGALQAGLYAVQQLGTNRASCTVIQANQKSLKLYL